MPITLSRPDDREAGREKEKEGRWMEGSPRAQGYSPPLTCCLWKTRSARKMKDPASSVLAFPGNLLPRRGSQGCSGMEKLFCYCLRTVDLKLLSASESRGAFVRNADAWALHL